jgi:hypothetical protein
MQKIILLAVILATAIAGLVEPRSVYFGFLLIVCSGLMLAITIVPLVEFLITAAIGLAKIEIKKISPLAQKRSL